MKDIYLEYIVLVCSFPFFLPHSFPPPISPFLHAFILILIFFLLLFPYIYHTLSVSPIPLISFFFFFFQHLVYDVFRHSFLKSFFSALLKFCRDSGFCKCLHTHKHTHTHTHTHTCTTKFGTFGAILSFFYEFILFYLFIFLSS